MTTSPGARLAYVNLFAKDIEGLARFYSELLGLLEIEGYRSPIYRCLDAGGVEIGFNADAAYDLLALSERRPGPDKAISAYFTFELPSRAAIDDIVVQAVPLGGRIVRAPYTTYYNAWQALLEDPEGNVFRVNHRMGPRRAAAEVDDPPWRTPT